MLVNKIPVPRTQRRIEPRNHSHMTCSSGPLGCASISGIRLDKAKGGLVARLLTSVEMFCRFRVSKASVQCHSGCSCRHLQYSAWRSRFSLP